MIVVVMRRLGRTAAAAALAALAACSSTRPIDPLQLDGNLLIVTNQTPNDWTRVEIWLNTYYRQTTDVIPSRSRFQAPLDTFTAGFGQRFNFRGQQVRDLRLSAKTPDGQPVEIKLAFRPSGLDVLKRKP
jgi:hypothetical protein